MSKGLPALLTGVLVLAGLVPAPAAHALSLLEAWQTVRAHAPAATLAQAARAVGRAQRDEAGTLWRPSVGLAASAGLAHAASGIHGADFSAPGFGNVNGASFNTSINAGPATHVVLEARQPLFDRSREVQGRQLELADERAELQLQAATQQLMLQSAEQYFAVVLAERRQAVLEREQQALDGALDAARERFAAGDAPVLDTHEVRARDEAVHAERLAAQSEAEWRRAVLADNLGQEVAPGSLDAVTGDPALPVPGTRDGWLEQLRSGNPTLRAGQLDVESARQDARRYAHESATTVDLVAQLSHDRMSGTGQYGEAGTTGRNGLLAVQVNIPLSTGGWREARQSEALRQAERAEAGLAQARQSAELELRHVWLDLAQAPSRLKALDAAVTASRARLDATVTGREVGDRTTLDLLNAQADAARAELALDAGRVDVLLARLRLAALAGTLDDATLQAVSLAQGATGTALQPSGATSLLSRTTGTADAHANPTGTASTLATRETP